MPKAPSAGRANSSKKSSKAYKQAINAHINVFKVEPMYAQGPLPQTSMIPPAPRVPDTPDSGFTTSSREATRSPCNDNTPPIAAATFTNNTSKRGSNKDSLSALEELAKFETQRARASRYLRNAETALRTAIEVSDKRKLKKKIKHHTKNLDAAEANIAAHTAAHPQPSYAFRNSTVDEKTREVVCVPEEVYVQDHNTKNSNPSADMNASGSLYEVNEFGNVVNEPQMFVPQEYEQVIPRQLFTPNEMYEQPPFVPAPTRLEHYSEYSGNQFSFGVDRPAVPGDGHNMSQTYPYPPVMCSQSTVRSESVRVSSDPRSIRLHQYHWDGYEYIKPLHTPFDEATWYSGEPVASTSQAQGSQAGYQSHYQQRYAPY